MSTPPDPEVLYPDIVARGSLAAALETAAQSCGLIFPVVAVGSEGFRSASVESELSHRNPLWVSSYVHKRRWSIRATEAFQDLGLIDGDTDDLAEVAKAANAWHAGASLDDIRRAAPFVHLTGRFEVPDHDPVRLIESEWQQLRTEASELDTSWASAYYELIEAAYAEPALRKLYPFTSHWALRFATTAGRQIVDAVGPVVFTESTGRYSLRTDIATDDVLVRTASGAEAAAAAVQLMLMS